MVYASLLLLAGSLQATQPVQAPPPVQEPDEIIGIDLGSQLRLSQSAEYGWRFVVPQGQLANLKRDSVAVRVDSPASWRTETWLMPFVNTESDIASVRTWPDELFKGKHMIARYTARRENGYWFESSYEQDVVSFHAFSRYAEAPGQRYVVTNFQDNFWYTELSHGKGRPSLEFRDDKGTPIPDAELVNRPMILDSVEPVEPSSKRYTFTTEFSPKRKVTAVGLGSILRYANIDALTTVVEMPKQMWYRVPGIPMLDKTGTVFVLWKTPDRKIKISGVYTLYKGRKVRDNPFDSNNPGTALCMQPLLVIFDKMPGDFGLLVSTKGLLENLQFGTQSLVMQDRVQLFQFISSTPPSESGFTPGSKWEKASKAEGS